MMDLVDSLMKYEEGYATPRETLELFSHLVKTGMAWSLQGSYGRAAEHFIREGLLDEEGDLTGYAEDMLYDLEQEDEFA